MLSSTLLGFLLSVVSLSKFATGDPTSVLTFNSVEMSQNDCGYFGVCSVEIHKGDKNDKNDKMDLYIPTTKELPPEMTVSFIIYLAGSSEPIVYNMTVCDAMTDKLAGEGFVKCGRPKESFPKRCPFGAGDFSVIGYSGPTEVIPPGIPDGEVTGKVLLGVDGQEPCMTISYSAMLGHALPSIPKFGR